MDSISYDAYQWKEFLKEIDLAVESEIKGEGKGDDFHFLLFCDTDFFFNNHFFFFAVRETMKK